MSARISGWMFWHIGGVPRGWERGGIGWVSAGCGNETPAAYPYGCRCARIVRVIDMPYAPWGESVGVGGWGCGWGCGWGVLGLGSRDPVVQVFSLSKARRAVRVRLPRGGGGRAYCGDA